MMICISTSAFSLSGNSALARTSQQGCARNLPFAAWSSPLRLLLHVGALRRLLHAVGENFQFVS